MTESKRVVVVDDCGLIRDMVAAQLGQEGFEVATACDGAELLAALAEREADLVILDLQMPGQDGYTLVRLLRRTSSCGIIMLSAKGDALERAIGLEVGADDFLAKPYEARELLARVRSVLRRMDPREAGPISSVTQLGRRDFGAWYLDLDGRCLGSSLGTVEITGAEFRLLAELSARPGCTLSREVLLGAVYDRPWDYFDRSIDVLVTRLRKKLKQLDLDDNLIRSVRGSGYMFRQHVANQLIDPAAFARAARPSADSVSVRAAERASKRLAL